MKRIYDSILCLNYDCIRPATDVRRVKTDRRLDPDERKIPSCVRVWHSRWLGATRRAVIRKRNETDVDAKDCCAVTSHYHAVVNL